MTFKGAIRLELDGYRLLCPHCDTPIDLFRQVNGTLTTGALRPEPHHEQVGHLGRNLPKNSMRLLRRN